MIDNEVVWSVSAAVCVFHMTGDGHSLFSVYYVCLYMKCNMQFRVLYTDY